MATSDSFGLPHFFISSRAVSTGNPNTTRWTLAHGKEKPPAGRPEFPCKANQKAMIRGTQDIGIGTCPK